MRTAVGQQAWRLETEYGVEATWLPFCLCVCFFTGVVEMHVSKRIS